MTIPCDPQTESTKTQSGDTILAEKNELVSGSLSVNELEKQRSDIRSASEPPDGGYGWVIVACSFTLSGQQTRHCRDEISSLRCSCTQRLPGGLTDDFLQHCATEYYNRNNATFGVYLSYYRKNQCTCRDSSIQ